MSVKVLRRHRGLTGGVAAAGLLVGVALALFTPRPLTGKAVVALPRSAPNMATQAVIAASDPVLSGALPQAGPGLSLNGLRREIHVKNTTPYLITISATSSSAARAEAMANAVADAYIGYIGSGGSPFGSVPAAMFEPATTATGQAPAERLVVYLLLGIVAGGVIGVIAALLTGAGDRRLRERDDIASSIGLPVLASLPVGHPGDAAGWTRLLDGYQPGAVHAWRLRGALRELGVFGGSNTSTAGAVNGTVSVNGSKPPRSSLSVLSLSSDPGSIALGPQLAVFAASLGIPTALVIGPQQDAETTATLRTACAVPPSASSSRHRNLRVEVRDDTAGGDRSDAALTVVVSVVDDQAPKVSGTMRTTATVLGVSAGAATAEQLARTAVSAAADGREVCGVLLADPEPTDRTSGRLPPPPEPPRKSQAGSRPRFRPPSPPLAPPAPSPRS